MRSTIRSITALFVVLATLGVAQRVDASGSKDSPKRRELTVRVVDQAGAPLAGAVALACPFVGDQADCSAPVASTVNRRGIAELKVASTVRYSLFAFVRNPVPAWACPGFEQNGDMLYLSDHLDALGAALPKSSTMVIHRPSPADCVPIRVVDDTGATLPTAGLFVCAHLPGSTDCIGNRFDGPDGDGIIRLPVRDDLVYDLGAFIANTGWPCPWVNPSDGTTFHFSPNATYTGIELLANGATFVIHQPTAAECPPQVVINVVDDTGAALPTAGLFVCAHLPGSTDCIGNRFDGPDGDGIIRLPVRDDLVYDLGAFIANTGWPCPWVNPSDGTTFHFSPNATYTGIELIANGATFVIHQPIASECP